MVLGPRCKIKDNVKTSVCQTISSEFLILLNEGSRQSSSQSWKVSFCAIVALILYSYILEIKLYLH